MQIKLLSGRCGGMKCIGWLIPFWHCACSRMLSISAQIPKQSVCVIAIMKQFSVFRFSGSDAGRVWPTAERERGEKAAFVKITFWFYWIQYLIVP